MDRESVLEAIYEDDFSGNASFLSDVEMADASEDDHIEDGKLKSFGGFDFQENLPENTSEKTIGSSVHDNKGRPHNKKKYRKNRNNAKTIGNINRFVIDTCRQLKEPKSYLVWEAIRKLGVSVVKDFVEEVIAIECRGGEMTADGKRRRTPGGILWNILKLQEPEAYKEIMLKGKDFEKELRKENNKRYGPEAAGQQNSKRYRIGSDNLGRNGGAQVTESMHRHFYEPCKDTQSENGLQEKSLQDPMVKAWVDGIRTGNKTCGNRCRDDIRPRTILSEKVKLPVKDRIRVPVGYDDLVD
ncbi:hypothetical protein SUGI_0692640 [Cryptomeria japonica]|uniref:uncharacterized protein LOC131078258 n=1 Tax=Cryptomeria japonica TaxID=3369 RepID=UPI002414C69E|nr:uncharacterized protein LOC131078258 [Cryptomeria japonica]GLJ34443.1 hypothetical protein SUGI_0692640 [Cryptomeria japonica]